MTTMNQTRTGVIVEKILGAYAEATVRLEDRQSTWAAVMVVQGVDKEFSCGSTVGDAVAGLHGKLLAKAIIAADVAKNFLRSITIEEEDLPEPCPAPGDASKGEP